MPVVDAAIETFGFLHQGHFDLLAESAANRLQFLDRRIHSVQYRRRILPRRAGRCSLHKQRDRDNDRYEEIDFHILPHFLS